MLFSVGRSATRQMASTALATSFARAVFFRAATKSHSRVPGIYAPCAGAIRSFASLGRQKKASASKSGEATPTKKPVKKPAKKPVKKSTSATKAKAKSKSKPKATKKPKAAKRSISPERKAMLERQALKRAALYTQPRLLPSQPWLVFVKERIEAKAEGQPVINMMASVAKEFKALSSGEIERLGSIAEKNKLANAATYKAWVESHSPLDTYNANKARKSLKKKFNFPVGALKTIHDERLPKKPSSPYALFTKARWASGDYTVTGSITEHAQSISREWKSLTTAERQPYEDLARSSTESYNKAMEALVGRE